MSRASISSSFDNDGNAARALASKATELMPQSVPARRKAVDALMASGQAAQTEPSGELAANQAAANAAEELRRFDPDSKLGEERRAKSQLFLSFAIVDCYRAESADKSKNCEPTQSLEDAESMDLDAIATLRALTRSDPNNLQWQTDLADALQVYAKVLADPSKGQKPESLKAALAALQESERIYTDLELKCVGDTTIVEAAATVLEDKAAAIANLGPLEQAKGAMESAKGKLKALTVAHEDNAAFKKELTDLLDLKPQCYRNVTNLAPARRRKPKGKNSKSTTRRIQAPSRTPHGA